VLARVVAAVQGKGGTGAWVEKALYIVMVVSTVCALKVEMEKRRPASWARSMARLVFPWVLAELLQLEGPAWEQLLNLASAAGAYQATWVYELCTKGSRYVGKALEVFGGKGQGNGQSRAV
jgi:hypothetical protein